MKEEFNGIKPVQYLPGMFDEFKAKQRIAFWDGFPEMMWGLGYEMDGFSSFEGFRKRRRLNSVLMLKTSDERTNTLYLLKHANCQIVGNYLFSQWRYFTHWGRGFNGFYDYEYLCRIIDILESKYEKDD